MLGSMGDWPCFDVITISVESKRSCFFNSLTNAAIEASTNLNSSSSAAPGVPAASRYPPVTPLLFSISFWPTLTAWKFIPKIVGTWVFLVPRWFLPSISLRMASTFNVS